MSTHTYKKFEDVESGTLPDKMAIFQECVRTFNATPVDAKKSRSLIAKLLRLLYNGETFPRQEATSLFFSISKLFQHKDSSLRQIVYLAIKELSTISDDVLMVTSSIMKDVQNGEIIYRPNAIRTLVRVLDGSTVHATERLIKTAIIDRNSSTSSAALTSSYHLLPIAKEVVKRWTNETQESVNAIKFYPRDPDGPLIIDSNISQYHALGLLYSLRNHDRMALRKIVQQYSNDLKNDLAIIQLIRYVNEILESDNTLISTFFPLLQGWLNHRSSSVNLEAAKVVTSLPVTDEQFNVAVVRLQLSLSSTNSVIKFSALRILNRISLKSPERIAIVNTELESLISDSNISIATYAITTLLKTGSSSNIEGLIKNVSKFINDISDEFKIIIIDSIRTLSIKFPEKYQTILDFLIEVINDEGGFEFQNAVVEALFDLVHFVEASRDLALENLCEFIEDCEFTELSVRILNLLGNEGPKTSNPTLYIRHIYNRVVLENSIVRSAAVVALSKFALIDGDINRSIKILLQRIVTDVDDEVRDRAIISLKFLQGLEAKEVTKEEVLKLTKPSYIYDLPLLEKKLQSYISGDAESFITPFDISTIPTYSEDQIKVNKLTSIQKKLEAETHEHQLSESADKNLEFSQNSELSKQQFLQELSSIEEFSSYGAVLHSSNIVALTERETEFVVDAVKHIFKNHIVLQFTIENTLDDNLLDEVSVVSQPENDSIVEDFIIPIPKLNPHSKGTVYVSFSSPDSSTLTTSTFSNTLSFTSRECDATTLEPFSEEGFQDEYEIEELTLSPGDYIVPSFIGNFDVAFDELSGEDVGTYSLDVESIQATVDHLVEASSLHPVEGKIALNDASHVLKLFGKTITGERVGALVKLVKSSKNGITFKAVVKAETKEVAEIVLGGFV